MGFIVMWIENYVLSHEQDGNGHQDKFLALINGVSDLTSYVKIKQDRQRSTGFNLLVLHRTIYTKFYEHQTLATVFWYAEKADIFDNDHELESTALLTNQMIILLSSVNKSSILLRKGSSEIKLKKF